MGAVGGGIVAGEDVAALVVPQAASRCQAALLGPEDAGLCVEVLRGAARVHGHATACAAAHRPIGGTRPVHSRWPVEGRRALTIGGGGGGGGVTDRGGGSVLFDTVWGTHTIDFRLREGLFRLLLGWWGLLRRFHRGFGRGLGRGRLLFLLLRPALHRFRALVILEDDG